MASMDLCTVLLRLKKPDQKQRPMQKFITNHATCSTTSVYMWSALFPISNHSHIRQLQFATHVFSQKALQQAVQISICQWSQQTAYEFSQYIET